MLSSGKGDFLSLTVKEGHVEFTQAAFHVGPGWAPVGPRLGPGWAPVGPQLGPGWAPVGPGWAPVGPRLGLTGAHLGMLLGQVRATSKMK